MEKKNEKYLEGHFVGMWMGIGIAICSGVGIPLSIVLKIPGLIGIWPAMGMACGLSIGLSIESKYKKEGKIRPLTEDEKKKRIILVIVGISVLIVGSLVFLLRFFL